MKYYNLNLYLQDGHKSNIGNCVDEKEFKELMDIILDKNQEWVPLNYNNKGSTLNCELVNKRHIHYISANELTPYEYDRLQKSKIS